MASEASITDVVVSYEEGVTRLEQLKKELQVEVDVDRREEITEKMDEICYGLICRLLSLR